MNTAEKAQSGKTSTSVTGSLKLRKKRKMQAWQAYHTMTYESKWKAEIDREWKAYCERWEQSEHAEGEQAETRFNFMNTFIKDKFNNETEEVKKQVEEYRSNAVSGPSPNINTAFQG